MHIKLNDFSQWATIMILLKEVTIQDVGTAAKFSFSASMDTLIIGVMSDVMLDDSTLNRLI